MKLNKNIVFIVGPSKCGKSLFAEKLMMSYEGIKCYIGTLPKTIPYKNCILEHQKRRPVEWSLLELTGDLDTDKDLLNHLKPFPDAILLDGLSFYFFRVLSNMDQSKLPSNINEFVINNLKMFLEINASYIIIDNVKLETNNPEVDLLLSEMTITLRNELAKVSETYINFNDCIK